MENIRATKQDTVNWIIHEQHDNDTERLDRELLNLRNIDINLRIASISICRTMVAIKNNVYGESRGAKSYASNIVSKHVNGIINISLINNPTYPHEDLPLSIIKILDNLDTLSIQPSERFIKYIQRNMDVFNTKNFASMIQLTARLALKLDNDFIDDIVSKVKSFDIEDFSPTDMLFMLHSLAVIDATNIANNAENSREIHNKLKDTYQYFCSNDVARSKISDAGYDTARKCMILDSFYWFNSKDLSAYPRSDDSPSSFEASLEEKLNEYGAKSLDTLPQPVTKKLIDLKLKFNTKSFYVEADGLSHLLKTSDGNGVVFNGNTLLQTMLQNKRTPDETIVRITSKTFNAKRDTNIWADFLSNVEIADAGVYSMDDDGGLLPMGINFEHE